MQPANQYHCARGTVARLDESDREETNPVGGEIGMVRA